MRKSSEFSNVVHGRCAWSATVTTDNVQGHEADKKW